MARRGCSFDPEQLQLAGLRKTDQLGGFKHVEGILQLTTWNHVPERRRAIVGSSNRSGEMACGHRSIAQSLSTNRLART